MFLFGVIAAASVLGASSRPILQDGSRELLLNEDTIAESLYSHIHGSNLRHEDFGHFTMTVGGMLNLTDMPWKGATYGGACLDFNIGDEEKGGPARVDTQCNGDPSKKFYVEGEMIKNDLGHCLDVDPVGGEINFWRYSAHKVVHYPCHGYSNQLWTIWTDQPKASLKNGVMITSRVYAPGEERCLFMDNTPPKARGKQVTPGELGYVYAMNCTTLSTTGKFKETSLWNFGLDI